MIKSIDIGFIISRVMNFYAIGNIRDALQMPLVTFWMLHKNIDRITAENDIRMVEVNAHSQTSEGITELIKDRRKQMGTVIDLDRAAVVMKETLDREGLAGLKALGR